MTHELKILPDYYDAVLLGTKTFEIRKDDRGFKKGDTLLLREWDNAAYTGRETERVVSYIHYGNGEYGLAPGYCVMGLKSVVRPAEVA